LVARVIRAPEAGETITGQAFNIFGGGKGANQALACARSGAATAILGALGDDDFGRQRIADLRADNVDVQSVPLMHGVASGVALITVESSGENRIAYVPGATARIEPEAAAAAFQRVKPDVVLSTIEVPGRALEALFREAKSAGSQVIVNATPEPRSGLELLPLADVLIVNETEALELLDRSVKADWGDISEELRNLGPQWIVITLGAEGALSNVNGSISRAPAPRVKVTDTTGAGDAFCGTFAARLATGSEASETVRAGVAAGTLAVTVEGAQRSMPTRAEVDRLIDDVLIVE
jgi:ribokinase